MDVEAFVGVVRKLMEGPKLCFLPLGSHGHWTLLVVDRRHEPAVLRCCCTSFKKISPNHEVERTTVSFFTILNLRSIRCYDSLPNESERCRGYAEKILASLLSMGLVHEAVLLARANKVFQGLDECGLYLLAAVEDEAATAMGHGRASTGWPAWAARRWHELHNSPER